MLNDAVREPHRPYETFPMADLLARVQLRLFD
jgi:hypothetical protein